MSKHIETMLTDTYVSDSEIYFEDDKGDNISEWDSLIDVIYTPTNQYCTKYGIITVMCICKKDPVERIDL